MADDAWEHHNPTHVVFGRGSLTRLPSFVEGRVLVITTAGAARRGLSDRVRDLVPSSIVDDGVLRNPTTRAVEEAIERWRGQPIDAVVAIGGGSAMDTGKVVATALADRAVTLRGLLEPPADHVGIEPVPLVAVPTTAGTGAEVTATATIWDMERRRKLSASTPRMYPTTAIVDPDLTDSLPWEETLSTGLDALSQCFEAICNRTATPVTDALAERCVKLALEALPQLRSGDRDGDPRAAMAEAALLSGLAISQTRTGLAHSISYPITAHLGVPHGLACGLALPGVLRYNAMADDGRLARLADHLEVSSPDGIATMLLERYRDLGVPELLRTLVPDVADLRAHRDEMFTPGRADTNFRPVEASAIDSVLAFATEWLSAGDSPSAEVER